MGDSGISGADRRWDATVIVAAKTLKFKDLYVLCNKCNNKHIKLNKYVHKAYRRIAYPHKHVY